MKKSSQICIMLLPFFVLLLVAHFLQITGVSLIFTSGIAIFAFIFIAFAFSDIEK